MRTSTFSFVKYLCVVFFCGAFLPGCSFLDDLIQPTDVVPTKDKILGVWKVVEATEADTSIMSKISINVPVGSKHAQIPVLFDIGSDNGMTCTCGPMATYIVYGGNKYAGIASKIDQFFNYFNIDPNHTDYGIAEGVVDTFAIEFRLESLPGTSSLVELLSLLGINVSQVRETVYHKFQRVGIEFPDAACDTMVWDFTTGTNGVYSLEDANMNKIPWAFEGWSVDNFSRCRFVLVKQAKTLADIVDEAKAAAQ